LQHTSQYNSWKAAGNTPSTAGDPSKVHDVKGSSILFRLPYWKVSTVHVFSMREESVEGKTTELLLPVIV
jgi:hypothetical protein